MSDVLMPRLSDSMEEGTIIRWLKADGDKVKRGEEIVEIETDKAIMAYESDFTGVLAIVVAEGSSVAVGAVIGQVGDGAAAPPAPAQRPAPATTSVQTTAPAAAAPATVTASAAAGAPGGASTPARASLAAGASARAGAEVNGRAKVSPLARRTAERLGVELLGVAGSGPHGRILKADVIAAAQAADVSPGAATGSALASSAADTAQPLSSTQRLIARRMSESRSAVPEFALEVDVDMSEVIALRQQLKALADPSPSINDVIVKACAVALRRHPRANGSFAGDQFVLHDEVNVAVAVAADDSLVASVIRDADSKSIGAIASESRAMIERVRARRVVAAELEGGTFTVSNLGMYGIDRFEGIINAPQAAILCVGAIRERPVARGGQVEIAPVATLTLASDHRILYGADAALFLTEIRDLLEAPLRILL